MTTLGLRTPFDKPPIEPKDFRPHRISTAEWQAGVTPGNEQFRILLNGEPVPLAFAASESKGWVMAFADPQRQYGVDRIPRDALVINPHTGDGAMFKKLIGYVQIVKGDPLYREF